MPIKLPGLARNVLLVCWKFGGYHFKCWSYTLSYLFISFKAIVLDQFLEYFVLGLVVVFFSFLQTALSFVKCRGHIQSNVRNSPSRKWLPICISYGAVFEYDSTHFQWVVWPQRSAKGAGNSSKQSHYIFFSFWLISMIRR